MPLIFQKLARRGNFPANARNTAFLKPDNWDDFGHKTLFTLVVYDEQGYDQAIGNIKIGFIGQDGGWPEEQIPQQFHVLPEHFFSLGQDSEFYINIINKLSNEMAVNVFTALGDVVFDNNRLQIADNERSFNVSLLRTINRSSIEHQFRRIIQHEAPLTAYDFFYERAESDRYSGIRVEFTVEPNTKPPSNIHILIGRNGVGKTTLLNNMVDALLPDRGPVEETGYFSTNSPWGLHQALSDDYFAGVVSVSFSAFDPFIPPMDQLDTNAGMRYSYVGLKKRLTQQDREIWGLKNRDDLCNDFTSSLMTCFSLSAKRTRWENSVKKLESDLNFAEMDLCQLLLSYDRDFSETKEQFIRSVKALFKRMSSGHAVVLVTITKLVETVEEKTLILFDEPESHLHPPLLSAFTRALSDLLINRNGVAIIATHSPVVLQEVPRSCVSILRRTRLRSNVDRPEIETFGENVGVLTRETFGLEVSKSGYHALLAGSVAEGKSYEEVAQDYQNQLGFEGKTILRSMIANRDMELGAHE